LKPEAGYFLQRLAALRSAQGPYSVVLPSQGQLLEKSLEKWQAQNPPRHSLAPSLSPRPACSHRKLGLDVALGTRGFVPRPTAHWRTASARLRRTPRAHRSPILAQATIAHKSARYRTLHISMLRKTKRKHEPASP
jgi:hypothetical protein